MTLGFPPRLLYTVPLAHGGPLALGERPLLMGIVNVTPDSFADAQRFDTRSAVEAALRMQDEGADLLDIGGESTRPGAAPVSVSEEMARVIPVIRALAGLIRLPISVDTYKAEVARAAVAEGAAIVNDVSALQYEPVLASVVARSGAALVLMHTRGRSRTMYTDATYGDVVAEVTAELQERIGAALAAGVSLDRIVVDPGIGFAKRQEHSYGVLAGLSRVAMALERPILVGPSRKSFMKDALDDRSAPDRDWGTAAAVTAAVLAGAHIVRVHAVSEMRQVVRVAEQIRRAGRS